MNIVSLLPSTTEICFLLGMGEQLRGVTHECDYPPAARLLPHLTANVLPPGEHSSVAIDALITERVLNGLPIYHLDTELLERLEPDLILTQELCAVCAVSYDEVLAAAQALPRVPRVVSFEPASVDDVLASIVEIAALCGVPELGTAAAGALQQRLERVAGAVAGRTPVRTVCLEWLDPPMVGGHWVPEMVRLAGGVDLLGPEGMPSIPVTWEQVAAADPDALVLMPCGYDLETTRRYAAELDDNHLWRQLRAVREDRAYPVDGSSYFNRPGPRLVDGVELLADLLHPECFSRLEPILFTPR